MERRNVKMEGAIRYLLRRPRGDKSEEDVSIVEREEKQLKARREKVRKIEEWLDHNYDKPGKGGTPKKSNLTDNQSAGLYHRNH